MALRMYNFLPAAVSVFFFWSTLERGRILAPFSHLSAKGTLLQYYLGNFIVFPNDYLIRHYFEVGEAERLLILHPRRSYCVMLRST